MPRSKKALYFSEHESVHFVDAGFSTSHWRLRGEVPQMHLYGVLLPCEWCSESLSQLLKSWVASTHPLYFQSDEPLLVMTVWAQHIRLVLSRQEGRRAHCPPQALYTPRTIHNGWMSRSWNALTAALSGPVSGFSASWLTMYLTCTFYKELCPQSAAKSGKEGMNVSFEKDWFLFETRGQCASPKGLGGFAISLTNPEFSLAVAWDPENMLGRRWGGGRKWAAIWREWAIIFSPQSL